MYNASRDRRCPRAIHTSGMMYRKRHQNSESRFSYGEQETAIPCHHRGLAHTLPRRTFGTFNTRRVRYPTETHNSLNTFTLTQSNIVCREATVINRSAAQSRCGRLLPSHLNQMHQVPAQTAVRSDDILLLTTKLIGRLLQILRSTICLHK